MRFLLGMAVAACCSLGCATGIPPALLQAQLRESERWQRQYEEERARAEVLALELAAMEAAREVQRLEQAEAEQFQQVLREELARARAERHVLEEHNAQLQARERELTEMQEEMADVWFESALSRARRHSPAPAPVAAPAQGGQGASP